MGGGFKIYRKTGEFIVYQWLEIRNKKQKTVQVILRHKITKAGGGDKLYATTTSMI